MRKGKKKSKVTGTARRVVMGRAVRKPDRVGGFLFRKPGYKTDDNSGYDDF
jgi:hypothetical protein